MPSDVSDLQKNAWDAWDGCSFSLRGFALFWKIPERTVQRHAKAGKMPGLFKSGRRLKIRRCKASHDYGQMLAARKPGTGRRLVDQKNEWGPPFWFFGSAEEARKQGLTRESGLGRASTLFLENVLDGVPDDQDDQHFQALGAILDWDRAKTGNPVPDDKVWTLPENRWLFKEHPNRYRVIAAALCIVTEGEPDEPTDGEKSRKSLLPTQARIAECLGISRRTFIRKYPQMTAAIIKRAVEVILGREPPPKVVEPVAVEEPEQLVIDRDEGKIGDIDDESAGESPQGITYQTRGSKSRRSSNG